METSRTMQTTLVLAVIINYSQSVHVPRVVAAGIIRGWHLFLSELLIVWLLYSWAATIQGWRLFEEI